MACGSCGKARQGTSAVKSRRRESAGDVSQALANEQSSHLAGDTTGYSDRLRNYLQELRRRRS